MGAAARRGLGSGKAGADANFLSFALRAGQPRHIFNRGEWTKAASGGAFGAKVVAEIGYLTGGLGISHRDAAETMQELFAVKISVGSISAAQKRLSQILNAPVAALHELVEQELVSLVDEHRGEKSRRSRGCGSRRQNGQPFFGSCPDAADKMLKLSLAKMSRASLPVTAIRDIII